MSQLRLNLEAQGASPREAWESFVVSRFDVDVKDGGVGALATRLSSLDIELALFQDHLVVAKRRRNAAAPGCRLPSELLATVFSLLQAAWPPARLAEIDGDGNGKRYEHGWMTVTHVCHLWRTSALNAHDLWARINCVNLPPPLTALMLSRSKTMPLSLSFKGSGLSPEALGDWLYAPVLRRTRELSIQDMSISEFGSCLRLLNMTMPALETLTLGLPITVRLSGDLDVQLGMSSYPRLRRLTSRGLAINWSWPMFTSNLTHLTLTAHSNETLLSDVTLEPQLLPVISTMTGLQELALMNILPSITSSTQYELPRSLCTLMSVSDTNNLSAGHVPLLERSRNCACCVVGISTRDPSVLVPIVRELFQMCDRDDYPAVELLLFSHDIVVCYTDPRPRHLWRVRINAPTEFVDRDPSSRRCLEVAESDRPLRGWKISPYLHYIPMHALQIVSVASSVASLDFPSPEAWINAFSTATNVRQLMVSYRRTVNLFLALVTTLNAEENGHSGADVKFTLFPRLETLVLHDGLPTKKDDIALMDFLHVRESSGAKLQELMVEENLLSLTSIWDNAKEVTTVTPFKACSMDQALAGV